MAGLKDFILNGRAARLGETAGPPLLTQGDDQGKAELEEFRKLYTIPKFKDATFEPGQVVKVVIGMDGGSTSSKAVLIDYDSGELLKKSYMLSKGNPIADTKEILAGLKKYITDQGAIMEVKGFGATGYAADVLKESVKSDTSIVETVAHMMSATHYFGDIDVICDIGGQDIKVLFMQNGDIKNFRLSNQCSAGNGMLLQAMADQFGVKVTDYADVAFEAKLSPKFSYGCAVFLDSDRVNFQKEGFSKEELLAGLAQVLPKNVWQYVVQIPRMAELGKKFVLQGGTQHNLAALKAQVDYIKARVPGAEVYVHPHTGEAGAIGAAMETRRVVMRKGYSTFIGIDAAINLKFQAVNDESTRCHFCPNNCARTFIDTETPDGRTSRYISGFSCEKGTVESEEAMIALTKERKKLMKEFPNLVDYESKQVFRHFYDPEPMPEATRDHQRHEGREGVPQPRRQEDGDPAQLPAVDRRRRWAARRAVRVGIPKVLNNWTLAPFFRTYLETLGLQKQNVVFSDETSEEMWQEGGKYGSIDPCYPSKVAQAHIHNLLFHHHEQEEGGKKLKYLFFPCITHVLPGLNKLMDTASCPIVAGAPEVMKAAFTKETDFFAERGITYVDPALTFTEPSLLKSQLFAAWGPLLGVTEDESDFACEQGWKAMDDRRRRPAEEGARDPRDRRGGEPRRGADDRPPVPLGPGAEPRRARGVPGARLPDPVDALDPEGSGVAASVLRERHQGGADRDAARGAGRVAGELLGQLGAEGLGGEVRGAPPERRRAGPVVVQVRPRRADLRPHRLDHLVVGDALLGAARHRRQQAGRLDQDPRQDLRPLAEAARGAARGHGATQRRAEVPHGREAAPAAGAQAAAARGAQAAGSGARSDDQRDEGEGRGVLGAGRGQQARSRTPSSRPRTRAWCGWGSRSASTIAKSWRAFNAGRRNQRGNCRRQETRTTASEASDSRRERQRRHRRRRRAEEVRAGADGGARPRSRQGALARRQPDHLHRRASARTRRC